MIVPRNTLLKSGPSVEILVRYVEAKDEVIKTAVDFPLGSIDKSKIQSVRGFFYTKCIRINIVI